MPNIVITFTINMYDNGQVDVSGPVENKVLCYGLLEVARDAIAEHAKKAAEQRIVTPGPAGLSLVTKG